MSESEYGTCVHEAGHAVVGLRLDRGTLGIHRNQTGGTPDAPASFGQALLPPAPEEVQLQPAHLRGSLTVVVAGAVAPILHHLWEGLGNRWPSDEERRAFEQLGGSADPDPFSSIFSGHPEGQQGTALAELANEDWPEHTDLARIANLLSVLCLGRIVHRSGPAWDDLRSSAAFQRELREAEVRAAGILRDNWLTVLRLADALFQSVSGELSPEQVREVTGALT